MPNNKLPALKINKKNSEVQMRMSESPVGHAGLSSDSFGDGPEGSDIGSPLRQHDISDQVDRAEFLNFH